MAKAKKKTPLRILGAMSGTSCDGLDIAIVEFERAAWSPGWSASLPYPKALRERVLNLQKRGARTTLLEISALDRDLGRWYGNSFRTLLDSIPAVQRPDVISNHGQTVAHFPFERRGGTTVQLGDPSQIAQLTGLTVVSHHRYGDLAAGGQGAPFVPSFHALLGGSVLHQREGVAIHNLGGISNFTYLGPKDRIIASDTGVANIWIDECVRWLTRGKQTFDRNGEGAAEGEVDLRALQRMLKHPFLKRPFPKSTGRDDFPSELLHSQIRRMKKEQVLATVTAFTVESIARAYEQNILRKKLPLKRILLAGGGAKNETILAWLRQRLDPVKIDTIESLGLDSQYVEAQAFAYLGFRALLGLPLGGAWTGGEAALSGARITPGPNWNSLLQRLP